MAAPPLDQGGGVGGLELRVALEADGVLAPGQTGVGGERAGRDDPRVGRDGDHLILMRHRNGDGWRARVHPRLVADHVIAVQADAPALVRLLDLAAEGMGDDLMPEADAQQPRLAPRRPQPLHQRRNPRQVVIDPRRRAGDDGPGVDRRVVWQVPRLHVEPHRRHVLAQQGAEPGRIVVKGVPQMLRRVAGFQDGDTGHVGVFQRGEESVCL
ncbi:hypothetical protein D3C81_1527600 [compost metagenome]